MRIAFLNVYQGGVERGAETFVSELSERLKKNHEVVVFEGKKKPLPRWPILWRLFIDPQGLAVAGFTLGLTAKLWRGKYDIVVPLNGGWQPAFVRLITWLYGGKMVISGQSGKGWDDRNNLWSFPNAFVALSTKLKGWAKRVNPLVRVVRIPNGVDTDKFRPIGEKIAFKLPKPIILSVGALNEEKRMTLVIKAVAKLKEASLVIVGKGPLKGELEKLGHKLLGERFKISFFEFKDMPRVYRAADLFTLASPWYRSFEIVLVEAMASGLAVVANKDEIRREIVGRAGVLVDPTNTTAYSIALENALKLKWGRRPVNQARKFDWDGLALKYEKLFSELIK